MNRSTTFDSTKELLSEILKRIETGKTQLPDFQRGWIWDDSHIISLLASVSLSFPIGAIMVLEMDEDFGFKPRFIEGVVVADSEPDRLILDGQQRLTSLFQSLMLHEPVRTRDHRGNRTSRWYYIDIKKALKTDFDREEAIISVPDNKRIRNFRNEVIADYSTPAKEYEAELFPLNRVFASSDWRAGYNEFWDYEKEKIRFFDRFEREIIKPLEQYQLPVIRLLEGTPKEAVCLVFEKVNTGGVSLNVFELLTATFAMDDFKLREDWNTRESKLKEHQNLKNLESTDFLQAISLLVTRHKRLDDLESGKKKEDLHGISCKRKDILQLTVDEYRRWADEVTRGFEKASRLLYSQKFFTQRDIPYRTQLVPLAAILVALGENADSDNVRTKLLRWFWCGVFGELYGSAVETRFARDLPEVLDWINGKSLATTVSEANFVSSRLYTLRTRNSAAYKGLFALLMRDGGLDFKTGETIQDQVYFDDRIDIHHIFPKHWCEQTGKDSNICDSIVNKTPVSAKTNKIIGGKSPSVYLGRLQRSWGISEERMDGILRSHVIRPELVRTDSYEDFVRARTEELLNRIEKVMGKAIVRETLTTAERGDLGTPVPKFVESDLGREPSF